MSPHETSMHPSPHGDTPLAGKIAVVTGAARGIGAAIAEGLARMGAHAVLTARDQEKLSQVRDRIVAEGGSASVVSCDLEDPAAIAAFGHTVLAEQGRCDVLVNNAGLAFNNTPLTEMPLDQWNKTFDVNLRAVYLLIQAFAPSMAVRRSGHIVNISSLAGRNPLPLGAAYAASKWALNGLTYSVAEELRQYGVRVSVVAPGSVNTGFGRNSGDNRTDPEKAARRIQPQDIADVVAMLVTQRDTGFVSEVLVRPLYKP